MAERPLNPDEAALWGRVVATVAPLPGRSPPPVVPKRRAQVAVATTLRVAVPLARGQAKTAGGTLDGSWDRQLARGSIHPDRSIDLHGQTLDRAYAVIDGALEAAIRGGERVVLMVTGKARPEARQPGPTRGAIRAVVGDWLAASRHASAIAAVRPAHPRHGGAGALYVILRRR